MKNVKMIIYWIARLVAALILLQTLFFKFTAAEESVYIFTTVGMEPWGRIGVGILEFFAAILLIIPATAWMGGILALGLMLGAIGMHLTILGIEVKGDGGYLFALALAVSLCSIFVVWQNSGSVISHVSAIRKRFN
jgi:putative oxidoreductase